MAVSTLPGANVYLEDAITRGTVTDIDGSFTLNGIEAGDHVLVVSFLGYESKEIPVQVEAGRLISLDVQLSFAAVLGKGSDDYSATTRSGKGH